MDKDEFLLKRIRELANLSYQRDIVTFTDFLNLNEQNMLVSLKLHQIGVEVQLFGGYEHAERQMAAFFPGGLGFSWDYPIDCLKIEPKALRFSEELGHRDYLGAVIKLGVKREKVGDIIVGNDGADIIVDKDISKFLLENLSGLTRFSKSEITIEEIDNLRTVEVRREEREIIVSSLRMDNVISELARCSRNKALDIINMERVFVNFQCETKKTKQIKTGDMVTIRGKGRFYIKELVGQTKSGRVIVKIEKFV